MPGRRGEVKGDGSEFTLTDIEMTHLFPSYTFPVSIETLATKTLPLPWKPFAFTLKRYLFTNV